MEKKKQYKNKSNNLENEIIGGGNMEHYILSDGFKIPKIGFGTAGFKGSDGARRIEMALNNGYR